MRQSVDGTACRQDPHTSASWFAKGRCVGCPVDRLCLFAADFFESLGDVAGKILDGDGAGRDVPTLGRFDRPRQTPSRCSRISQVYINVNSCAPCARRLSGYNQICAHNKPTGRVNPEEMKQATPSESCIAPGHSLRKSTFASDCGHLQIPIFVQVLGCHAGF